MLWRNWGQSDIPDTPLEYSIKQEGWNGKLHNYYIAFAKLIEILDVIYSQQSSFGDFTLNLDYHFIEEYEKLIKFINFIARFDDYRNKDELEEISQFKTLTADGKFYGELWKHLRGRFSDLEKAYKDAFFINDSVTLSPLKDLITEIDIYLGEYRRIISAYLNQPAPDIPLWLEYEEMSGRLIIGYRHQKFLLNPFTVQSDQERLFTLLWNSEEIKRKDLEFKNPSDRFNKIGFENTIGTIFLLRQRGVYKLRKQIRNHELKNHSITKLEEELARLEQIS